MIPLVTVIVPCRNDADRIEGCVTSLLADGHPHDRLEILVVDGRSTDESRDVVNRLAAAHPCIRLVDNPGMTTPRAFNAGIAAARGDAILILGAHAAVMPGYLARCTAALQETGADAVGGAMRTRPGTAGPVARAIVAVLTHPFGVGNARFRTGSTEPVEVDAVFGEVFRRDVFDRIGRFNEALTFSQDMEFNLRLRRAGGRILLLPDIATDYYARTRLGPFLAHTWRNGVWAVLPFALSPAVPVALRHLVPGAFAAALIASAGLAAAGDARWLAGVCVLYAVGAGRATIHAAIRARDAALTALFVPLVFAMHLTYGLGSLWGLLRAAATLARQGGRRGDG